MVELVKKIEDQVSVLWQLPQPQQRLMEFSSVHETDLLTGKGRDFQINSSLDIPGQIMSADERTMATLPASFAKTFAASA